MEIKINIPQNDYIQPTEAREEIVQTICEGFLSGRTFHPFNDGAYRQRGVYVGRRKDSGKCYFPCRGDNEQDNEYIRVHGVEVKAAFKALQDAGYYMFRVYEYGSWLGYKCSKKPSMEKGTRVTEFSDFID